jgi:hypothetical protein
MPSAEQQNCKHVYNNRCFLWGPCRRFIGDSKGRLRSVRVLPCRGRVEYLHRDFASRKRRQNGKSHIWDSKIWSRVPRDSNPRKTALGRPSSIYKRQTRPLVREGAPQKRDRNCQRVIAKYLVMSSRWGSTPRLFDWLTVSRNVTLTNSFQFLSDSDKVLSFKCSSVQVGSR